jgi:hypothetical protein
MKRLAHYLVLIGVLLPSVAGAVDTGIDATTLLRIEQQSVPGFTKQTLLPATQFIGADLDKLADGNLSFHLYGWGRVDLADSSTSEGTTDGDLTYAYLKYRFPRAIGEIRGGRFFVTEGVAAEQVDGVSMKADLCRQFGLSLFGGAPVKLENARSKGDIIYGGRANVRLGGMIDLGVSALHEGNVTVHEATDTKRNREMLGVDIWFSPFRMVEVTGHSYYNITTHAVAEHSYMLTLKPVDKVTVTGIYNNERLRDYFIFTNVPSIFNPVAGEDLKSYVASVSWVVIKPLEIIGDYRHYKRDTLGNSDRYGAEARFSMMDNKVRTGASLHRSRGGSGINAYTELRGYGSYRDATYQGSLDAIVQYYDTPVYAKSNAYELTASAGYRLLRDLVVSGDIVLADNPRVSNDVRGLLRLTYNFNYSSKGAKP